MEEESTLREDQEGYQLECLKFTYGDVTMMTFRELKAVQWTR